MWFVVRIILAVINSQHEEVGPRKVVLTFSGCKHAICVGVLRVQESDGYRHLVQATSADACQVWELGGTEYLTQRD